MAYCSNFVPKIRKILTWFWNFSNSQELFFSKFESLCSLENFKSGFATNFLLLFSGELDTLVNFTAKQSISRLMETNPKTVKENLISNCAQILACYRKNCASPSSAGQLILPECMKLLPLYTNCLLKSDAISGGADVGCDDRAFLMSAVGSMDVVTSVAFFYPRLFPIHDLKDDQMPK